jgi:hypothetical protein
LQSTWKLKEPNYELDAYDLLGKFYFYTGNMNRALEFHTRMAAGKLEPENSSLRRLAIQKLNSGSVGK